MATSAPFTVDESGDPRRSPSASTIVFFELSGYYELKIEGYSQSKAMIDTGSSVAAGEFDLGGHTWRIRYAPNSKYYCYDEWVGLYLELTSAATAIGDVEVALGFRLIDEGAQEPLESVQSWSWKNSRFTFTKRATVKGYDDFVKRQRLEWSKYLKGDCFTVRCDLTVFARELRVEQLVTAPPPALHRHLGKLLSHKDQTDVSFKAGEETFAAHRCILAARSPVFMAELFGSMRERTATCIDIDDMDADVFRAFLHFIYNDELPEMEKEEVAVMAQHLLVAADRYDMKRLKMICENELCRHLDVSTAATTMALAEQHCCPRLKKKIFSFLGSPAIFKAVVETDGYKHLMASCPSITSSIATTLVDKIVAARSRRRRRRPLPACRFI